MVKRKIKQKGVKIINTNDYSLQSIYDIKGKFSFCTAFRNSEPAAELYRLKFDFKIL